MIHKQKVLFSCYPQEDKLGIREGEGKDKNKKI